MTNVTVVWTYYQENVDGFGWFIVLNATFNNISVISWQSVLWVEETGVPWENHQPVASDWKKVDIKLSEHDAKSCWEQEAKEHKQW